jgi:hypothetical protein
MTNIWNEYANRKYMPEKLLKYKIDFFKTLFKKFKCDTNKTAIEIGAGHGISSEIFIAIFNKYIATEPNKIMFAKLLELKIINTIILLLKKQILKKL